MDKFKTLMVYPNTPLLNPPPISYGIFTALLREADVDVRIFDTTFHLESAISDESKKESLQVRPYDYDYDSLPISRTSAQQGLQSCLNEFQPDLIVMSTLESTWDQGTQLLDTIQKTSPAIPVLVGGIFPTFAPQVTLSHPAVTMVCIAEGEGALIDVVNALRNGSPCDDIDNIWLKSSNGIIRNGLRKPIDINTLPLPDYSAFHPAKFLRPMAGKVYRTIPIETNRGCPYSCTFCNSPSTVKMYRSARLGHFFRKKHWQTSNGNFTT